MSELTLFDADEPSLFAEPSTEAEAEAEAAAVAAAPPPPSFPAARLLGREGRPFTAEQVAAIEQRSHSLVLSANAGSGKTSVLVERFVRAVREDGVDPSAILAITFTEKAAGELRDRVRARFAELGDRSAAQAAEGAFVSTIHGFCARLLRAHPLTAGLDPSFTVLDEPRAARLREQASSHALGRFMADGGAHAVDLTAAYGPDRLAAMVRAAHDELRSRGQARPRLPPVALRPAPDAERRALHAAHAAFAQELFAAGDGKRIGVAREALDACERFLADLDHGIVPWPGRLEALTVVCGNVGALATDACVAYVEARDAFERACADHHAAAAVGRIDVLLGLYGEAYDAAKAARGALDFDDLELRARDLLRDHGGVRSAWRERFALLMVDEFQDTNRRQLEVLEALEDDNLFSVGDEFQSIYGFRHADVEIIRARRTALAPRGLALGLAANFRSAPQILAALNRAFAERFSDFLPLAGGREDEAGEAGAGPAVELLVTAAEGWDDDEPVDLGDSLPPTQAWRRAEARLVAERVRELVDAGEAHSREVAVLVRAAASMPVLERALEDVGLRTLATAGRGFWSRQQVVDLMSYAAALANPLDERALVATLASPLAGVSTDALSLIAAAARERGRGLWWSLEAVVVGGEDDGGLAPLAPGDRARLHAFVARMAGERERLGRVGLDELLERAMGAAGYEEHVLGLVGGERRLANVRKVLRLAREFEAAEGRDLRAFVDHAASLEAAQRREPEAPVSDPDADAVRLMTIHAAKGLEFGVVVAADLGRRPNASSPDLLVDGDRVGLRLAVLDGGATTPALDHAQLAAEAKARDAAEEDRVLYVALTRAQRRLIVSGGAPATWNDGPPLAWLAPALVPDIAERLAEARPDTARATVTTDGVEVALVLNTPATIGHALREPAPVPGGPLEEAPPIPALAADASGGASPEPAAPGPAALSYSALTDFARCGLRFYARRVLGLPPTTAPPTTADVAGSVSEADTSDVRRAPGASGGPGAPRELDALAPGSARGLDSRVRGVVVHGLVEELDLRAPAVPSAERIHALAAAEGATPQDADIEDARALVAAFAAAPLRVRLAGARSVRREHEFAFALPGGGPLLTGVIDLLAIEPDGTHLVVDLKTDGLAPDADLEALTREHYGVQRGLYALAALTAGAVRTEIAHLFLERPDGPATQTFTQRDLLALQAQIAALSDGLRHGRFPLTDAPHAALCAACPARGGLCPYPAELTLRPAVA